MDKKMQIVDEFSENFKKELEILEKEHGITGVLLLGVPKEENGEKGLGMVHVNTGDVRKSFLMLKAAKKETKRLLEQVSEKIQGDNFDEFLKGLKEVAKKHFEEKREQTAGDGMSV